MVKIEAVLKGGDCVRSVGEGPVWNPKAKSLLYVDIFEGDLHRFETLTNTHAKIHVGIVLSSSNLHFNT